MTVCDRITTFLHQTSSEMMNWSVNNAFEVLISNWMMLKSIYAQAIVHVERLTLTKGYIHVGLTTRAHQAYNINKERG